MTQAARIAYRPAKISISVPVLGGVELITVTVERMELAEDGTVLAIAPANNIFAVKSDELETVIPGIDGAQVREVVSSLARRLIASELGLEIGESGFPEKPFNEG